MATLPELLKTLVENNGSDLHLTTHTPPQIRVHGKMQTLDLPSLGPAETKHLKKGVNTLALYTNVEFQKDTPLGMADVFLEGLDKKDLDK